jgi:flagellar M-ring protein FliF
MSIRDYWAALGRAQRIGLGSGVVLVATLTGALGTWALRDPWVPVATGLSADRVVALTRELSREKLEHRVGEDGAMVEVRQSAVGRARATAANGGVGLPPNVGLEIFKETDFSTTDFAQRINYQRALQGELARTLQTIAGVRSARVHVVLPEAGVLRRDSTRASAAVTLALVPGRTLGRAQLRGVQRLVAASVPNIKADEVVVLDESGASLSGAGAGTDAELSSTQLDLKRQVDAYFEAKLTRLLEDVAPGAQVTLSVDTVLDHKQLRVTLEEPLAAPGSKDVDRPAGVVVRERQLQRSSAGGAAATGTAAVPGAVAETTDFDFEYKVGHRIEHSSLPPGTLRRVSVAVVMHGAPPGVAVPAIESLVAHAVGIDRARGDAVMVMLLEPPAAAPVARADLSPAAAAQTPPPAAASLAGTALPVALLLLGGGGLLAWAGRRRRIEARARDARLGEVAHEVRRWLSEEPAHGRD